MNDQNPIMGVASGERGSPVTAADMARVTPVDYADIQRMARAYCRAVDVTRSRKRMDGSATVVREGVALYGTDDVSDDVAQDAVLMFARRLRQISESCEPSAVSVATREAESWQYICRDGRTIIVDRHKIMFWAVRDSAARNGYRIDVRPDQSDAEDAPDVTRGIGHADVYPSLFVTPHLAAHSAEIFRSGWGDGRDFPTLAQMLQRGAVAEDIKRAPIMGETAQAMYGGPRNSSSKVQRARDAARKEWRELSSRLDAARDQLIYRGTNA